MQSLATETPARVRSAVHQHAEDLLCALLADPDLEMRLARTPHAGEIVSRSVRDAIHRAYGGPLSCPASQRFLQRVLYRINRLMLFWYDALTAYENDRSPFILGLRAQIETAWQDWERRTTDGLGVPEPDVAGALRRRAARDVDSPPSPGGVFFRDRVGRFGYERLVEIASLDGLVEASQLSRTLGGVGNDVHSTMTRLLIEEYGGGRPGRKHSSYFRRMMEALDLDPTPEAYFEVVPWEVLATINHSFLLSDRKRHFLRYVGGLLYTEVSVPAAFRCFSAAGARLGLPPEAVGYWDLHIKEDARHGPWMLEQVALPLAARYPAHAAELLWGYDQQLAMSARAGRAVAASAAAADGVLH